MSILAARAGAAAAGLLNDGGLGAAPGLVVPVAPGTLSNDVQFFLNATGIPFDVSRSEITVPANSVAAQSDPHSLAFVLREHLLLSNGGFQPVAFTNPDGSPASAFVAGLASNIGNETIGNSPVWMLAALLATGTSPESVHSFIDAAAPAAMSQAARQGTTAQANANLTAAHDFVTQWSGNAANLVPHPVGSPVATPGTITYGRDLRAPHTSTPTQECQVIYGPGYAAAQIQQVGSMQTWVCILGPATDPNDVVPPAPTPSSVPDCVALFGPGWAPVDVTYDGVEHHYECALSGSPDGERRLPTGEQTYPVPDIAVPPVATPPIVSIDTSEMVPGSGPVVELPPEGTPPILVVTPTGDIVTPDGTVVGSAETVSTSGGAALGISPVVLAGAAVLALLVFGGKRK